jgi:hypothetical protein
MFSGKKPGTTFDKDSALEGCYIFRDLFGNGTAATEPGSLFPDSLLRTATASREVPAVLPEARRGRAAPPAVCRDPAVSPAVRPGRAAVQAVQPGREAVGPGARQTRMAPLHTSRLSVPLTLSARSAGNTGLQSSPGLRMRRHSSFKSIAGHLVHQRRRRKQPGRECVCSLRRPRFREKARRAYPQRHCEIALCRAIRPNRLYLQGPYARFRSRLLLLNFGVGILPPVRNHQSG